MPPSLVAIRFVLFCKLGTVPPHVLKLPHASLVLCSDHELEHPKTLHWFERALVLYPLTHWICHADDDTYVQTRVLYNELARIQPAEREIYGLMYHGTAWDGSQELNGKESYFGSVIEDMVDPSKSFGLSGVEQMASHRGNRQLWGMVRAVRSVGTPGLTPETGFRFPFLQGGFYAITRDLIARLLPEAHRLWDTHADMIRARKLGEDAFVFYSLHRGAAAAAVGYRIRHLTWSRAHFLPINPLKTLGKPWISSMGWVYPSNDSSSVVHWIKYGDMELVHNVTRHQAEPIFEPFAFRWEAREARLSHDAPRQLARWSIYRKCCWIFGCHAPFRKGNDLKACFVEKSADLSDGALERLRSAPPFSDRERLGSEGFPVHG